MAQVTFRLNRPKASKDGPLKETPVSVLVQLYINDNIKPEIATGEKVIPKFWNKDKQRVKSNYPNAPLINDNLSKIETALMQFWRDSKEDLAVINSGTITPIVRGKSSTVEKKRIFEALDKFLAQYKAEKEAKTLGRYNALKSRLIDFDKIYPVDFENLDFNFYDGFKKFLYSVPNPNYNNQYLIRTTADYYTITEDKTGDKIGLFDDTVFKYFINLKTFLAWSEKRGYKPHESYKTWEIIKRKHQPISLTLNELQKLSSAVLPKHLDIARDYLLIECYTGQRISDIKAFNAKDYADEKWTFRQKKGNRLSAKTVTVHFKGYCRPALLILQKYNFKLPIISEQKLNKNIKTACEQAGITTPIYTDRWAGSKKIRIAGKKYEFISSHTGRKTFITLALQSGMPEAYVKVLTGITESQTIKHYQAEFEEDQIKDYLQKMEESTKAVMKKAN